MVTIREREGRRSDIALGEKEIQTVMYTINYKDTLYNAGNIDNNL